MRQEIRQSGETALCGEDGCSIPMIFNSPVGKNLRGRRYSDYIASVATPGMGFTYGKVAYYSDGSLIIMEEVEPQPSLLYVPSLQVRDGQRSTRTSIFTRPWERIDPTFRTHFFFFR